MKLLSSFIYYLFWGKNFRLPYSFLVVILIGVILATTRWSWLSDDLGMSEDLVSPTLNQDQLYFDTLVFKGNTYAAKKLASSERAIPSPIQNEILYPMVDSQKRLERVLLDLKKYPDSRDLLLEECYLLLSMHRKIGAIQILDKLVEIDPNHPEVMKLKQRMF